MSNILFPCGKHEKNPTEEQTEDKFDYKVEQFADLKIMRYQIPGFNSLSITQKKLIYFLSKAAIAGRDIIFDQNYKHNLCIRRTLEAIFGTYKGNRETDEFEKFLIYLKQVWFSNGIHHHYSTDKFFPEFSKEYFASLIRNSEYGAFPIEKDETIEQLIKNLTSIIFDTEIDIVRVSQNTDEDLITKSANNFYEGVSQQEVENYYKSFVDLNDKTPVSYGLNSKVVKVDNKVQEKIYSAKGMYATAIVEIIKWLTKAIEVAENKLQKRTLQKLVDYYKSGNLKTWDEYNILWVKDLASKIDVVNGFIEVYGDPLGKKATWESVVNFKNIDATKRATTISENAQWFEDNSPINPKFKKLKVKGVSAKVITIASLGGDCYPSTPVGINLPNADWIRKEHGSKSVTIDNIMYAYHQASIGNGFLDEFCFTDEEIKLSEKHGFLASNLHTDLHECLGHGSGQLLESTNPEALKNYASALEEARADLFALYYIMDNKMIKLGLMPNLDVAKSEYNGYIRNGLMTQLTRVKFGKDIQQAHMRNRQLIAKWSYEKGKNENVIEKKIRNHKTYFVINDYEKLRVIFGKLLIEIQRIKSEGDYDAGKKLIETYAVKVDSELHKEVLERYSKLNLAPYGGFINPNFIPVMNGKKIIDIIVEYQKDYSKQMMDYSTNHSFLPTYN